jgi:coiled-coil domain-containing protein 12
MMSDRQARLAALAAKAGRIPQQRPADQGNEHNENNIDEGNSSDGGGDDDDVPSKPTPTPTLSFRNYVPKDASLDAPPPPSLDAADDNITNKRQKTSTNSIAAVSSTTTSTNTPPKSALEIALANTDREARMAAGQTVAATTTNDVGGGGGWSTVVTPSASTKKVNWDLKRDIQHKMDKLEKRTQRAIVQLLRERLEKEAETAGGVDDYDDEVGDID